MFTRKTVVAGKVESTPGTAVSLSGTDCAMNAFDLKMAPDADMTDRPRQGSFGRLHSVYSGLNATATWKTQLVGGSSIPFWASVFLPAAGFPFTSAVAAPVETAPDGSTVTTLTIGGYIDGVLRKMRGCVVNPVFNFANGMLVDVNWTARGLWVPAPTDTALPSPTYPADAPLHFSNVGLTVGSWAPKLSKITLDLGGKMEPRPDVNAADNSGVLHFMITDRVITGTMDPEATLVATNDAYNANGWYSMAEQALDFALGSTGNKVAFHAPKFQILKPDMDDRNGIRIDNLNFVCNPSSGADALSITIT